MATPIQQPESNQPATKRSYARLIACVVIATALTFVGWPVYRDLRKRANDTKSRTSLRQIALALHNYHDAHGRFPPAYVLSPSGERLHSWRVLLLPCLGQQRLYDEFRLDESWSSPHNRAIAEKSPDLYQSASAKASRRGVANFLAVVGRATAWPEQYTVRLDDIGDGTSNTIQLLEWADSDIFWTEPRDLTTKQALGLLKSAEPATPQSGSAEIDNSFLAALADGAVRRISPSISRDIFRGLLSINSGTPLIGVDWPDDDIPIPGELPPPRPASELPLTEMLPHPFGSIVAGRNSVYCATFAIAWDDACRVCGVRPLRLAGDPPLAQAMNRHQFDRRNLAEESFLAAAGVGNAPFRGALAEAIGNKFPGANPKLIAPDRQDHVLQIYAYLLKQLPFHVAFERLGVPLQFHESDHAVPVVAFGAERFGSDFKAEQVRAQVTILDYAGDDDFVLQLTPAKPRDEIILAKVAPAPTLDETIAAVRKRIAQPDPRHQDRHFLLSEPLAVPELAIGIEREYSEIVGADIIGTDLYVGGAWQIVKFHLDENGAVLESEAVIMGDNGHTPMTPAGHRKFIFDRPFLIYLIERNADQPYFATWIANSELMVPVGH
jgi:Protein of unknown function (DUF1559)